MFLRGVSPLWSIERSSAVGGRNPRRTPPPRYCIKCLIVYNIILIVREIVREIVPVVREIGVVVREIGVVVREIGP